jgi:hypothetical protein
VIKKSCGFGTCLPQNVLCRSLRDHECRRLRVTVGLHWEHARIRDPKASHSMDSQLAVDHAGFGAAVHAARLARGGTQHTLSIIGDGGGGGGDDDSGRPAQETMRGTHRGRVVAGVDVLAHPAPELLGRPHAWAGQQLLPADPVERGLAEVGGRHVGHNKQNSARGLDEEGATTPELEAAAALAQHDRGAGLVIVRTCATISRAICTPSTSTCSPCIGAPCTQPLSHGVSMQCQKWPGNTHLQVVPLRIAQVVRVDERLGSRVGRAEPDRPRGLGPNAVRFEVEATGKRRRSQHVIIRQHLLRMMTHDVT